MSAAILPSARSRETLGEAGRDSSNNLCVAIRIQYHRSVGETNNEKKQCTIDEPKLFGPSAGFWADELGPRAPDFENGRSDANELVCFPKSKGPLVFEPNHFRSLGIEPMTCAPNAFQSGEGLVTLQAGQSFASSWGIEAS